MSTLGGRVLYRLYYQPASFLADCLRDGGPLQQRRTERGRLAMETEARRLTPPPPAAGSPLEIHLLTGRQFWYQTAFCLWTLARHARRPLAPVIYNDGTLEAEHQESLTRLFPSTRYFAQDEILSKLDRHLPANRFPTLRERWQNYPNLRKLIDPHLGSTGWKLVLDSDLLFFRRPDALLAWLNAPADPLHAVDCTTSYGYTRRLMNELAGAPVADLVNVGLTGLNSSNLDWERLEFWCRRLIEQERTHYYLEQGLIAMLLAGQTCTVMPANEYVTFPAPPEVLECRAVMHHYVAGSKRWYFQSNWQRALALVS